MSRYLTWLLASLVLCALVGGPAAGKEAAVGEITRVKGPVTVTAADDRQTPGTEGRSLFAGDEIQTGKGGFAEFTLGSASRFKLGEEAHVSLDELSSKDLEDHKPVLRLVLGYLWSKLEKLRGDTHHTVIHTPTAVIGVRGTEFDTVVSLDASSVVAVDEGSLELEVDGEKTLVPAGRMLRSDLTTKAVAPVIAVPREKRDWQSWRRKRFKRLFQRLPVAAPRLRARFERGADRFITFSGRVRSACSRISKTMEDVRRARAAEDRPAFRRAARRLKVSVAHLKDMVSNFRDGLNRVRVVGRLTYRIEGFVKKNRARFSEADLASIERNLGEIALKRKDLRETGRKTIFTIRKTFKELRQLRQEIRGSARGRR
jgi:FecR-like protein